jgi:hypothetical protein
MAEDGTDIVIGFDNFKGKIITKTLSQRMVQICIVLGFDNFKGIFGKVKIITRGWCRYCPWI